ncbi:hypothetical protein [Homoserinibacter sp. GY 40078]|uniref:hypothetical protein n=1 Tax=Homoserinibacter sp. GY 40078 TaxID=2603275 RepID=UPI00164EDE60|nr:hypothetical protein [Homoserinibacter sp. GY 40078]
MPQSLRLFLLALLMYVDAAGREIASSRVLREALYEFDEDVTPETVDEMLLALEGRGWLLLYESGRRLFLQVNPAPWAEFVSIDGRDGSRHPSPDPGPEAAQRAAWAASGPTPAEGKGESGGEAGDGERPTWMSDPDMPPPQGCKLHPINTGLIPCGACAGARKLHDQFIRGEISHDDAVKAWGGAVG